MSRGEDSESPSPAPAEDRRRFSVLLAELAAAEPEPEGGWARGPRAGEVIGRFELLRELGRGGFGVVFEARDLELGRLVAFKAVRPGSRAHSAQRVEWLRREAEATAQLSHENIVALHDAGRAEGGPFLVFELLEGETLAERLARGPLPPHEALRVATAIARALSHAHAAGVLHRDLKPSNVFLTERGAVKVLDFGLAHVFGRSGLGSGGTAPYMAAEQWRGDPEDGRTDLYAAGVLLYEMLTGRLPFELRGGRSAPLYLPPPALDGVPPPLRPVLASALAPDPDRRPRNAEVMLERLLEAERALEPERRRWYQQPLTLGAVVAVAVAAVAAAVALDARRPAGENPLADARFQQLTDFEGIEQAAALSRDGSFVAFQSDRDGPMDVWVTQVGTGRFVNLTRGSVPDLVNPSIRTLGFSPDGTLVTFWAHTPRGAIGIWAVPLLGGPPRPYLDGAAELDWSSDGARLVYHTPGPGDPMYVRDAAPPAEARKIFSAPPGLHAHFPLWSPDQAFIYFVQGSLPDHLDLWRVPASGGPPERITHHDALVSHPVFLDARTLLYLVAGPDGAGPWIYCLDVERRVPRRVSFGVDGYTSLAASADGRRVVATRASPKRELWSVPLRDGRAELSAARRIPLTTGNGAFPRLGPGYLLYVSSKGASDGLWKLEAGVATELWSAPGARITGAPAIRRDGRRIAFPVSQGGRALLYVVDADGSDARVVTAALDLRGAPAWTPDGAALTVAAEIDGAPRLFNVPLDGRPPAPFVSEPSEDPAWSPGGDVVAFSGADVGTAFPLEVVRADGSASGVRPLTLTRGARHLAFMPDGRSLVVLRGEIRHKNLWLVDLATGGARQVTDLPPGFDVRDFDVAPDGHELVLEQVQEQSDLVLIDLPR